MEQHEMEVIVKKRCAILDRATILEKCIKIPDPEQFMWTQTKKTMTSMYSGWRTGRILCGKRLGF